MFLTKSTHAEIHWSSATLVTRTQSAWQSQQRRLHATFCRRQPLPTAQNTSRLTPSLLTPSRLTTPSRPTTSRLTPSRQTPTTLRRTRQICAILDISSPHLTTLRHSPQPCRQTGHSHRLPPPCRTLRREPRMHASTRALLVSISHTAATLYHTTATLRHIAATLRHTAATLHHTAATLRHSPYPTSHSRYATSHSRYATSQPLR